MFTGDIALLVTVSSATLALVGGAGYMAGVRTARGIVCAALAAPDMSEHRTAARSGASSAAMAAATSAPEAPAATVRPAEAEATANAPAAEAAAEPVPSASKQRWALKPVRHVSDDQNVGMFAQFIRDIAGGVHAMCAENININVPGGLVPLLDDASLAADWLLLDELHEFYRGWCRLEGVMPITRAVLQEKIEAAGAVKKRHWAAGGSCERLRARVRQGRLPQRPVLVRVLSLQEMERRERSRHAGAGRATDDRDVQWTRAA